MHAASRNLTLCHQWQQPQGKKERSWGGMSSVFKIKPRARKKWSVCKWYLCVWGNNKTSISVEIQMQMQSSVHLLDGERTAQKQCYNNHYSGFTFLWQLFFFSLFSLSDWAIHNMLPHNWNALKAWGKQSSLWKISRLLYDGQWTQG